MLEILVLVVIISYVFLRLLKPKRKRYKKYSFAKFDSQNKQKGDKYELQIGRMFKNNGYKVYFKGINEGFDDGGIDLIAYKGNEAILIQCKNWENSQIKQEQLRVFLGDCTAYIEQNQKIFAKRNVKRLFITSCKDIDYGVKKFVEQNNLEYQIIPYEK